MNGAERDCLRRAIDEAQRARLAREPHARASDHCKDCGASLTDDNRAKNGGRGYRTWCKPCDSKRRLRYYVKKGSA